MKFLFVHNNFPGQFRHIAAWLAADENHLVAAIGSRTARPMDRVMLKTYDLAPIELVGTHPFARRFDNECRRAEQVLYVASSLASDGFRPDVIVVHSGWGENLTLRAVFPAARIIAYSEFYYRAFGQDVNFDPEFPVLSVDGRAALSLKNVSQLIGLIEADQGLTPTHWQKATFPKELRSKIEVIHEGIDTGVVAPNPNASVATPSGKRLNRNDEVVTYVSRSLEPIRGFHVLMRALETILKKRPQAEILIVGKEDVSYGPRSPGQSWKAKALAESSGKLDLQRIHFLGNVDYPTFLAVLQVSRAHLYLSYPFVLSWSFLEAMSVGAVLVASDTEPVREALTEDCGYLLPFHDVDGIADAVISILAKPESHQHLSKSARSRVVERYDLKSRCLPALNDFLFGR